jgi:apolipoprotein N-acyltransferase
MIPTAQRSSKFIKICHSFFFLTTGLYVIAFPPYNFYLSAYCFLVPFGAWVLICNPKPLKLFLHACLIGISAWMLLIIWLRHVSYLGLIGLSCILGLIFAIGIYWIGITLDKASKQNFVFRCLMITGWASGWVVLEWVRSWFLSGFPWLPLAATHWQCPVVLQITSITGAYGVSFYLLVWNGCLLMALTKIIQQQAWKQKKKCLSILVIECIPGLLLTMVILGYGTYRYKLTDTHAQLSSTHTFSVAIVQPAVPPVLKWNSESARSNMEGLINLSTQSLDLKPDIIVWPEAATPLPIKAFKESLSLQYWMEDLVSDLKVPILTGTIMLQPEGWYNGIVYVTPEHGLHTDYYIKQKRVPFGEYLPLKPLLSFLRKLTYFPDDIETTDWCDPLTIPIKDREHRVGCLICYEDIFPALARNQVLKGAEWLYVATNDAWWAQAGAAYQHAAHSVLRAVEVNRPIIRCGNEGWSGWIDARGTIRSVALDPLTHSIYFSGVRSISVALDLIEQPSNSYPYTFYVKWGDWFVILAACIALTAGWVNIKKQKLL